MTALGTDAQEMNDSLTTDSINTDTLAIDSTETISIIREPDSLALLSRLADVRMNKTLNQINLHLKPKYKTSYFTEEICDSIHTYFITQLPDSLRHHTVNIYLNNHRIEELVPNIFRHHLDEDENRMWQQKYKGQPWVRNISSHITSNMGLENTHIALWQSHGRYAKNNDWWWQRPRLFCTTEDLLTQTFVIPYIIPMLENAGAVVYTPRERDWQNNEVIVDNDSLCVGKYLEHSTKDHTWEDTGKRGFAHLRSVYYNGNNPFTDGTARQTTTTSSTKDISTITWVPNIPERGKYAVYVSYQTLKNSIDKAKYTVHHKGGTSHFEVNQQMGGGTWVYLGQFEFEKGESFNGCVELSNYSKKEGVVTADAVRFGGGMGNISREGAGLSGLPRWAEAARYSVQWGGFGTGVYNHFHGKDDYSDDLYARTAAINELCGGSVFAPHRNGRKVPFELSLAFHSDAGCSKEDSIYGSLTICSTTNKLTNATTNAGGISRLANYDLASIILHNLHTDLKQYGWAVRDIWDKNYCETREPDVPSVIVEMFSHQNFTDMRLAYNPQFKFDLCRSIYKSIVKYVATTHKRKYVIQPLPVKHFQVVLNTKHNEACLYWEDTYDKDEPTAQAEKYIVYTRIDSAGFDNGKVVNNTTCTLKQTKGHVYSYKVVAMNNGGISFPSTTLSAYISPYNTNETLLVDATTLSGPVEINDSYSQGFDINTDKGHQYGDFAGFCGAQQVFAKSARGYSDNKELGHSGNELEGVVIKGNNKDNIYPRIIKLLEAEEMSFSSADVSAVKTGKINLNNYQTINFINE